MSRRRSITPKGFHHEGIPIPPAAVVGGLLFSGGVNPVNYESDQIAATVEEQVRQVFRNIDIIVTEAGGTLDDVVKVDVQMSPDHRDALNTCWVEAFPDEAARPARKLIAREFSGPNLIQCEFVAVLSSTAPEPSADKRA